MRGRWRYLVAYLLVVIAALYGVWRAERSADESRAAAAAVLEERELRVEALRDTNELMCTRIRELQSVLSTFLLGLTRTDAVREEPELGPLLERAAGQLGPLDCARLPYRPRRP